MHCWNCKSIVDDSSVYCQHCGEKINKEKELNKDIDFKDKSNKQPNYAKESLCKFKNKRNVILGVVILILIAIVYKMTNYDYIRTVSKYTLKNIDISRYFPYQVGTTKFYKTVGDTGVESFGKEETIPYKNNTDESKVNLVDYSPLLDGELSKINSCEIQEDKIILFNSVNAVLNSNIKTQEIILNKETIREYEGRIEYVTAVNKTIETEGGVFEDCIEITTKTEGFDTYIKTYLAPELGEVLSIFVDDVNSDDIQLVEYELTGYELPNNQENKIPNQEDNSTDDNSEFNIENKEEGFQDSNKFNQDSLNIVDNKSEIIIEDTEFNFSIKLPQSWKGKYAISRENFSQFNINLGNTYSKTLDFLYTPQGLSPQYMFSLVVFNTDMLDGLVEEQERDIRENAVIINDEFYVECFTVPEPSQEIVNNEELLSEMMKMVNDDLPKILETIKFSK